MSVRNFQIEQYEKDERFMQLGMSKIDYPFDYFFAKTSADRDAINAENGSSSSGSEVDENHEVTADA